MSYYGNISLYGLLHIYMRWLLVAPHDGFFFLLLFLKFRRSCKVMKNYQILDLLVNNIFKFFFLINCTTTIFLWWFLIVVDWSFKKLYFCGISFFFCRYSAYLQIYLYKWCLAFLRKQKRKKNSSYLFILFVKIDKFL